MAPILIEIIFEDICNNQLSLTNLPGVLYGLEISSAIFRVRILENRVPRTIFQPKRDEVGEDRRRLLGRFTIHITHQILFELSNQR